MKITKEYINTLKNKGEESIVSLVSKYQNNSPKISFILNNLGFILKNYNGEWLFNYINNDNQSGN